MDTRFWGPDGWLLLHSITEKYPNNPTSYIKDVYFTFFHSIEYILPCIYCRESFSKYMKELPIENYLKNKRTLCKWLYKIHNKVNDKLKSQKLHNTPNPNFEEIFNRYRRYVVKTESDNRVPGFKFLYSIIFNHASYLYKISKDRTDQIIIFLNLLPIVLPFTLIKNVYFEFIIKNPIEKNLNTNSLKLWIFNLQIKYYTKINKTTICFNKTCNYINNYKAGCNNNTCRIFN